MRFTSIFATSFAIGSTVMAAPTTSHLQTRDDCPSVTTITNWLKDNTSVGNNTIFYAGKTKARDAASLAILAGGWSYNSIYRQRQYNIWEKACDNDETKLINRIREAVATASTGVAWVLVRPGDKIADGTIWKDKEYPALKKNKVTVWAVNSYDVDEQKPYDGNSDFSGDKVVNRLWDNDHDDHWDDDDDDKDDDKDNDNDHDNDD